MKVIIFGGFLGSGKTTLLLEFARYLSENKMGEVAIVENEIGKIGIDDKFLESSGYQVKSLFAGCICCTLVTNLVECVIDLKDKNLDWILIETTGVAYPDKVNDSLEKYAGIKAKVVCVTDAERWKKLKMVTSHLLIEQVKGADILIINKIDMVTNEEVEAMKVEMNEINKEAIVYGISAKNENNKAIFEGFSQ